VHEIVSPAIRADKPHLPGYARSVSIAAPSRLGIKSEFPLHSCTRRRRRDRRKVVANVGGINKREGERATVRVANFNAMSARTNGPARKPPVKRIAFLRVTAHLKLELSILDSSLSTRCCIIAASGSSARRDGLRRGRRIIHKSLSIYYASYAARFNLRTIELPKL